MATNNQLFSTDHHITLEEAVKMTKRFQNSREEILKPEYTGKDILPISETFNKAAFEELIAQPGCAGIRGYLSMGDNMLVKLIFVAVNEKNEDILPEGREVIIDIGSRCPPTCSIAGPLKPVQ